jgi:simple sugar transport system ATP-binding protein
MEPLLRVEQLTKRFPQVVANEGVSLEIYNKGEIHCLLGENGAGKSTLAECLYGFYKPDSGHIYFKGKPVRLSSPVDAIHLGIGMVHQHFVLVPPLTVIENVVVGIQ